MLRYIYTFVYMYDMNVKNTENMATQYIFPVRRKGNVTLDD